MNPPANEVLKNDLTAGLAAPDAAKRQQNVIDAIMKGTGGIDTPAQRQSRVDRAKLAASIHHQQEVKNAGLQVIDEAIARVATEKANADQKKLRPGILAAEVLAIDQSIALLEAEKLKYIDARREVALAAAPVAPAPAPAPAAPAPGKKNEKGLEKVVSALAGVTDVVLPKKLSSKMSREAKAIAAVATGAALVAGLVWLFNRGKDKAKSAGKGLLVAGAAVVAGIAGWKIFSMWKKGDTLASKAKDALKFGIDAAKYNAGLALYKVGQVDKAREIWGDKADEIIAKLEGEKKEPLLTYGLTAERYKEARKMYSSSKPLEDIKKGVFGLQLGVTSPEWEQFVADMKIEFAPEKDDASGIEYMPIGAALDSYQATAENICLRLERWMDTHKSLTALGVIGLARIGVLQRILSGTGSGLMRLGSVAGAMASMGLRHHKVAGLFALCGVLAAPKLAEAASENIRMPKNMSELLKSCSIENASAIKGVALGKDLATLSNDIGTYGKVVGDISGDIVHWAADKAVNVFGGAFDILVSDDAEVIASNHENTFSALRTQLLIDESNVRQANDIELSREKLQYFSSARSALDNYKDLFLMHRTQEDIHDVPTMNSALQNLQDALAPLDLVIAYRSDRLVWYDKHDPDNVLDFGVDPTELNYANILQVSQGLDAGESFPDRLFAAAIQRFRMEQQDNAESYPDKSSWMAMVVGNLLYIADPENLYQYYVVGMDSAKSLFDSDESWGDWAATVGDASMQTALMTLGPTLGTRLAAKAFGVVPLYGTRMQALRNFTPILGQLDVLNEFRRLSGGGMNFLQHGPLQGRKINIVLTQLRYEKEWFRTIAKTDDINELYRIASQAGIDLSLLKKNGASLNAVRQELRTGMVAAMNSLTNESIFRRMNLWARIVRGEKVSRTLRGGDVLFDTLASAPTGVQAIVATLKKGVNAVEVTGQAFSTFLKELNALRAGVNATGANIQACILNNIALLKAAAPTNRLAARLLQFGTWLRVGGRGVSRALPALGVILDALFIGINELEISEAEAAGNTHKADALRDKRVTLGISGGAGLALLSASPIIMAPAAVIVGAGMYSSAIYDDIVTWENQRADWLKYSPEDLEQQLRERKIGYNDIGMRSAAGHNVLWAAWRGIRSWTTSGKEDNDREDEKAYRIIEGVNEHVRQELLAAYFLQTLPITEIAGEAPQKKQERIELMVRDCLNYVRVMTRGSYYIGGFPMQRLSGGAHAFSDLMQMRRSAVAKGQNLQISYDWDGKKKKLDLSTLDYALSGSRNKDSMPFMKTVHQYQKEYSVAQVALQEINNIDV